jgi:hypothetical protein
MGFSQMLRYKCALLKTWGAGSIKDSALMFDDLKAEIRVLGKQLQQ